MSDHTLAVLQTVRLKGRVTADDIAAAVVVTVQQATETVEALTAQGFLNTEKRIRITADGREELQNLLAAERAGLDQAAAEDVYEDFDQFNSDFKELASDWQIRDGEPNDHGDVDYDAAVLGRLAELHTGFQPLLERVVRALPRLQPYPTRFSSALERVKAGDHAYFLRPVIDSYHTVWFELHEELIGMLGRKREDEARAGRAE